MNASALRYQPKLKEVLRFWLPSPRRGADAEFHKMADEISTLFFAKTLTATPHPVRMKGFVFIVAALTAVDAAINHSVITLSIVHGATIMIHNFKGAVAGSIFAA